MNAKPIILRILGWGVFLSFPLLIFSPFKGGNEASGDIEREHPVPDTTSFPKPVIKKSKPHRTHQVIDNKKFQKPTSQTVPVPIEKIPPKAIVVSEDPEPALARTFKPSLVSRVAAVEEKLKLLSSQKIASKKTNHFSSRKQPTHRHHRLNKHLHGKIIKLRAWASPRAIWGSRVHDFEELTIIAQRWHYGTGTLWVKVRKPNGRSGWLPHHYINY